MTFTVDLEHDEGGWWVASIASVSGCRTQARSIRQAMTRIREALTACVDGAEDAELVSRIRLPEDARRTVEEYRSASARLAAQQEAARAAADSAVDTLTRRLHLSIRDTADVLGLSHQRVHQLMKTDK